jgi:hypothetical protein
MAPGDQPKRLTADQCRGQANDCREAARIATKQEHQIMLQHMAETWDRIAADVADKNN